MRRNGRLYWVFRICEKLGIDDPIYWMDHVSPKVVDGWIAYFVVSTDMQEGKSKKMTGKEAGDKLRVSHGSR